MGDCQIFRAIVLCSLSHFSDNTKSLIFKGNVHRLGLIQNLLDLLCVHFYIINEIDGHVDDNDNIDDGE